MRVLLADASRGLSTALCLGVQGKDTGEMLVEGTSFARWLEGWISAEGTLYDREGEFKEGAFDEEDVSPAAAEKRERRALKSDPEAPAPAWRLARALARQKQVEAARRVLRSAPLCR